MRSCDSYTYASAPREFLYIGTTLVPFSLPSAAPLVLLVTHSRRHLTHVQVSNAHGWHGARNMARSNEQHKQQQQQQQKLKQQQQKQQQKQQQEQRQKRKL